MVRLYFVTCIQIARQKIPYWDSVTFAVLPYVMATMIVPVSPVRKLYTSHSAFLSALNNSGTHIS